MRRRSEEREREREEGGREARGGRREQREGCEQTLAALVDNYRSTHQPT